MIKHIAALMAEISAQAKSLSISLQALVLVLVFIAVILSALTVIYSAFLYRQGFNAHQQLFQQRDALDVEWGQLLLEQSALAAHSRVEKMAIEQLDMYVPSPDEIVVVR
ncbi:MAG: cell division protein FtsL [Motiliproteus sp.]|jgi:cell division protein FtsL